MHFVLEIPLCGDIALVTGNSKNVMPVVSVYSTTLLPSFKLNISNYTVLPNALSKYIALAQEMQASVDYSKVQQICKGNKKYFPAFFLPDWYP